ncbi:unnamed protein product, partial [Protopolystoma xenopodis]
PTLKITRTKNSYSRSSYVLTRTRARPTSDPATHHPPSHSPRSDSSKLIQPIIQDAPNLSPASTAVSSISLVELSSGHNDADLLAEGLEQSACMDSIAMLDTGYPDGEHMDLETIAFPGPYAVVLIPLSKGSQLVHTSNSPQLCSDTPNLLEAADIEQSEPCIPSTDHIPGSPDNVVEYTESDSREIAIESGNSDTEAKSITVLSPRCLSVTAQHEELSLLDETASYSCDAGLQAPLALWRPMEAEASNSLHMESFSELLPTCPPLSYSLGESNSGLMAYLVSTKSPEPLGQLPGWSNTNPTELDADIDIKSDSEVSEEAVNGAGETNANVDDEGSVKWGSIPQSSHLRANHRSFPSNSSHTPHSDSSDCSIISKENRPPDISCSEECTTHAIDSGPFQHMRKGKGEGDAVDREDGIEEDEAEEEEEEEEGEEEEEEEIEDYDEGDEDDAKIRCQDADTEVQEDLTPLNHIPDVKTCLLPFPGGYKELASPQFPSPDHLPSVGSISGSVYSNLIFSSEPAGVSSSGQADGDEVAPGIGFIRLDNRSTAYISDPCSAKLTDYQMSAMFQANGSAAGFFPIEPEVITGPSMSDCGSGSAAADCGSSDSAALSWPTRQESRPTRQVIYHLSGVSEPFIAPPNDSIVSDASSRTTGLTEISPMKIHCQTELLTPSAFLMPASQSNCAKSTVAIQSSCCNDGITSAIGSPTTSSTVPSKNAVPSDPPSSIISSSISSTCTPALCNSHILSADLPVERELTLMSHGTTCDAPICSDNSTLSDCNGQFCHCIFDDHYQHHGHNGHQNPHNHHHNQQHMIQTPHNQIDFQSRPSSKKQDNFASSQPQAGQENLVTDSAAHESPSSLHTQTSSALGDEQKCSNFTVGYLIGQQTSLSLQETPALRYFSQPTFASFDSSSSPRSYLVHNPSSSNSSNLPSSQAIDFCLAAPNTSSHYPGAFTPQQINESRFHCSDHDEVRSHPTVDFGSVASVVSQQQQPKIKQQQQAHSTSKFSFLQPPYLPEESHFHSFSDSISESADLSQPAVLQTDFPVSSSPLFTSGHHDPLYTHNQYYSTDHSQN